MHLQDAQELRGAPNPLARFRELWPGQEAYYRKSGPNSIKLFRIIREIVNVDGVETVPSLNISGSGEVDGRHAYTLLNHVATAEVATGPSPSGSDNEEDTFRMPLAGSQPPDTQIGILNPSPPTQDP